MIKANEYSKKLTAPLQNKCQNREKIIEYVDPVYHWANMYSESSKRNIFVLTSLSVEICKKRISGVSNISQIIYVS